MKTERINMIDVGEKPETQRTAAAIGRIFMNKETLERIIKNRIPKGNVIAATQTSALLAAKKTPDLLPLCHPLLLSSIDIDIKPSLKDSYVEVKAMVKGTGKTGFEMEALTAVSVALLNIYDMCKMFDKGMRITDIRLIKKTGGKSGNYAAE